MKAASFRAFITNSALGVNSVFGSAPSRQQQTRSSAVLKSKRWNATPRIGIMSVGVR
ncbi:MAG: hypothetical protein LBS19_13005 [Clostridiales bacterium]|nr:hypothetical protein [Clostridiales bacterium]